MVVENLVDLIVLDTKVSIMYKSVQFAYYTVAFSKIRVTFYDVA